MTDSRKAHLSVLIANLIYGANFSIAKIAMPAYIPPSAFILIRVAISYLLFELLCRYIDVPMKIKKEDRFRVFLLGVFGVAINQLLFFEGLSRTTNINAALIMTSNPILVLVVAALLIKETITSRRIAGILFGIAGAAMLIILSPRRGSASIIGDSMIFTNALSYAIYLVMVKPLMKKYNPWVLIRYTFLYGTLLVIPFGLPGLMSVQPSTFTWPVWMAVFYVVVCTTFFAYLFNTFGLRHLSPAVVSFYIYLQPLFATLISVLFMDEPVTLVQVVACLLIFTGIYLVSVVSTSKDQRPITKDLK